MPVHHRHDGMHGDAVLHRQNLYAPLLATLHDGALPIVGYGERAGGNALREFLDYLLTMCEQVAPLAAFLPLGATEYLVERFRHVGIFDYLLYDMTFSAHSIGCF